MFSLSTPGKFQINVPQHAQTAEVAEVLAKEGCGLVRLPWALEDNLRSDSTIYHRVQLFLDAGMKVVFDFHPNGTTDSIEHKWKLVSLWRQFVKDFYDTPTDQLAFHILNEPRASVNPDRYYRLLQLACEAVWDITPDRLCVFSNHLMGNPDGWTGDRPHGGPVAAAMSYYRPYDVVKEGSERSYPPQYKGMGKDFPYDDYKNQELHFHIFKTYCTAHNIQPWLSETGCHRSVPGRLQYAKDIKALGAKHDIPICWWAFQDEYGANPAFGTVKERDMDYWKIIKGAA